MDRMRLTDRQLNRSTLGRQLLLKRAPVGVVDGLRRIMALQAQEPASPYLALWSRLSSFDPADLDAAFATGTIVKASLMRITLHAVLAEDYPRFHEAMRTILRASRLHDARFTAGDLTADETDALIEHLLMALVRPHSGAEVESVLAEHHGRAVPQSWWALRTYAPLHRAPTGGPWSFGPRQAFIAAPPIVEPPSRAVSVAWLVERYLAAFGPATVPDIAQFTLLRRATINDAIGELGDRLEQRDGPGRAPYLDLAGSSLPDEDAPAPPRLLPMWDSILMAYADRSRVIPEPYRRTVIRTNGDTLPTLLVDGLVAGVWRPVEGGIEATAFHALSDEAWAGLASEAEALIAFLADRDPLVYRRYARWWTALPAAEVRVLPAGS
jgi:hypothetical protein